MSNVILYGLIGVTTSLVLRYLYNASTDKIEATADGKHILQVNNLYAWIGYPSVVIGALMGTFALVSFGITVLGLIFFLIFTGIFCGLGIPCVMYHQNHWVKFNDKSIWVTDVYGKESSIDWQDIQTVHFSPVKGLINVKTEFNSVKLHQHLVGLSTFMDALESKTTLTVEKIKLPNNKNIV